MDGEGAGWDEQVVEGEGAGMEGMERSECVRHGQATEVAEAKNPSARDGRDGVGPAAGSQVTSGQLWGHAATRAAIRSGEVRGGHPAWQSSSVQS